MRFTPRRRLPCNGRNRLRAFYITDVLVTPARFTSFDAYVCTTFTDSRDRPQSSKYLYYITFFCYIQLHFVSSFLFFSRFIYYKILFSVCLATMLTLPPQYFSRSFGFSIFPVALRGTASNIILYGRLYLGS